MLFKFAVKHKYVKNDENYRYRRNTAKTYALKNKETEKAKKTEAVEDGDEEGKESNAGNGVDESSLPAEESAQSQASQNDAVVIDALEQNLGFGNAP